MIINTWLHNFYYVSLAARALWRLQKHKGKVSDTQLTTLDLLQDHISDMTPEDIKRFEMDMDNFLTYWPHNSKQYGADYISHIFGLVSMLVTQLSKNWWALQY